MEEVTESLSTAWKEAMKGVKIGLKKTTKAFKQFPMDKLNMGGGSMSHGDIRRFFQMKYGAEVHNDEGERVAAAEASDVESSDGEALTDVQVHEKVDKKYFDKSYDAAKFELEHMDGNTYTDDEAESRAQREKAEVKTLELRQKCDVVSTTLKRRVLAHHHSFVSGTEMIREVNESLLMTSSDCKKTRTAIRRSKAAVGEQISLLSQHRTKANVQATITLLEAVSAMVRKRTQMLTLISSGKIQEASQFLRQEGPIEMEDSIAKIYSMRPVLDEWRLYRDRPEKLMECVDEVLISCLTNNFIISTYRNALEASKDLGKPSETCALIAATLWRSAIQILCKTLTEVSYVKSESAPLSDIAEGIHPDHLLLGVRQTAAKLLDFFYMFATLVRLHEEEQRRGSRYSALHGEALLCIRDVGRKMGRDIVEKLAMALSSARLSGMDVDHVLHLFVVTSMLIEGLSVLGLDKDEVASARTQTKGVLLKHMQLHFQIPKSRELVTFMSEDDWNVCRVSAPALNAVKPLPPDGYKSLIKSIKRYLQQSNSDDSSIGSAPFLENPFLSEQLLEPQDTSSSIQTQTFASYWETMQTGNGLLTMEDAPASGGNQIPGAEAERPKTTVAVRTLASTSLAPPTVLSSSSLAVANAFLEYEARVAVRFPPLAADILGWCEDLLCLYMYTVTDSFVSVSRSVPVERQSDFSPQTLLVLAEARVAGERAIGAMNGAYFSQTESRRGPGGSSTEAPTTKFPPHVWGRVSNSMVSAAEQYGIGHRAVACQSVMTLVYVYEAAIQTMSPLLPPPLVEKHIQRCFTLHRAAREILHVGIHRLCQAIFPMEALCAEVAKLKANKDEVVVSTYVAPLVREMKALRGRLIAMPTPLLDTLILQRLIFSAQATLLREYAKLSKKRLSDMFVMQLQVDGQALQQQLATTFEKEFVVLPDYVLRLIKAGFFAGDKEQCIAWVRANHVLYIGADIVAWLSGNDKPFKMLLEDLLTKELKHQDVLPMDKFAL